LDDLRTKAKLSHNQMIGLKYYTEFAERIPRDEVAQIEHFVCKIYLAEMKMNLYFGR
jgi:hypothetical protein